MSKLRAFARCFTDGDGLRVHCSIGFGCGKVGSKVGKFLNSKLNVGSEPPREMGYI